MKISYKLNGVEKLNASMTITMSVGQWEELRQQLDNKYPSWKLSSAIGNLVRRAKEHFYEEVDVED